MSSRVTDHRSAAIAAYLDSLSYLPGDEVQLHVSGRPGSVNIDMVRLGHDGSEATIDTVAAVPMQSAMVEPQILPLGSRAEAQLETFEVPTTVGCWFAIARLPEESAVITSLTDGASRVAVTVDSRGHVWLEAPEGRRSVGQIVERQWYLLAVVIAEQIRVIMTSTGPLQPSAVVRQSESLASPQFRTPAIEFAGNGWGAGQRESLDGFIEFPFVLSRTVAADECIAWNASLENRESLLADPSLRHAWDTAIDLGSFSVSNSNQGMPLHLLGGPTRAVPGRWWGGDIHDPRAAPLQFGAVHFHSDDLVDAGWPLTARLAIPQDAECGVYGVRVRFNDQEGQDIVPFIVRSGTPQPLTIVLPTLTYLAYANEHARPPGLDEYFPDLSATFARENGLHSWYDRHRDGSAVVLCSLLRPLFGFRHDHQFRYTGADHGISADLRLLGWLERNGFDFGLITDHDLDAQGADILAGVRCTVTGAHPEYWSERMMDALEDFLRHGGNLAYISGNGLLWSTHIDHARSIAEMRRGDVDDGPYEGDVAISHLQLSGKRSGMWQTLGRPAAHFTGLTAGSMGFTKGAAYRFTADAGAEEVAGLVEGVDLSAPFGTSGRVLGTAAAYETDFYNQYLGSASECIVIASAQMPDSYVAFAPGFHASPSGEDERSRRRSDMVLWRTPAGGLVWSVGSIAWTGALDDDAVVARLTRNALTLMVGEA